MNREVDRLLDGMLETQEYILAQLKELKSKIRGGGGGGG